MIMQVNSFVGPIPTVPPNLVIVLLELYLLFWHFIYCTWCSALFPSTNELHEWSRSSAHSLCQYLWFPHSTFFNVARSDIVRTEVDPRASFLSPWTMWWTPKQCSRPCHAIAFSRSRRNQSSRSSKSTSRNQSSWSSKNTSRNQSSRARKNTT